MHVSQDVQNTYTITIVGTALQAVRHNGHSYRVQLNGSVFIDLKKAFDTVDHNILLRKLSCYGVTVNALQLLKSYLIDRTQRSYVNGLLSTEQYVSCGIPQGSILGPFLFILFM